MSETANDRLLAERMWNIVTLEVQQFIAYIVYTLKLLIVKYHNNTTIISIIITGMSFENNSDVSKGDSCLSEEEIFQIAKKELNEIPEIAERELEALRVMVKS